MAAPPGVDAAGGGIPSDGSTAAPPVSTVATDTTVTSVSTVAPGATVTSASTVATDARAATPVVPTDAAATPVGPAAVDAVPADPAAVATPDPVAPTAAIASTDPTSTDPTPTAAPVAPPVAPAPAGPAAVTPAAAPAAPSAPAAPPAAQVALHVVPLRLEADGVHRLTVHLHPADLGLVSLVAEVRDGAVHLQLAGATEAGREALRDALPDLRRELQQGGFDRCSLDLGQDTPSGGHPYGREPSGRRTPAFTTLSHPNHESTVDAVIPTTTSNRRLDLRI
jgi:flagellar hook-length control protein FliK